MSQKKLETIAASNNWHHSQTPKPVTVPIYASSIFEFRDADHGQRVNSGEEKGYSYSRGRNPTVDAAAEALNELEGGEGTLLFSSGMAAISTSILALVKAGDHMVVCKIKNTSSHRFIQGMLPRYGIESTMVDGTDIDAYRNAVKSNTKVLFAETPCNPLLGVLDLEEFGRLGKSLQLTTMVDSTTATPFLQNPIHHGVDIVLHSCSKYLGGHSDIIAGSMTASSKQLVSQIFEFQRTLGTCLSPFDGFLLMRGIRTLHLRMERHCDNAMEIALLLNNHQKVEKVYYPGLSSHPTHSTAVKQMRGFGGLLAFCLKGGLKDAKKFSESVKLFKMAGSLGGTDSLVEVVCLTAHNNKHIKPGDLGIPQSLIRLSVGLAHVEDLKKDIEQALETLS